MKDFRYISDLTKQEFSDVLDLASKMKEDPNAYADTLKGKTLIMYFEKASTRTRLSFEAGVTKMGGHAIFFSGGHVAKANAVDREPLRDTAEMYSRFGDIIMARTFEQAYVDELAKHASVPVINGLTDDTHPVQALADLLTIREKKGFDDTKVTWVGDGNNVCNSLIHACAYAGIHINVATPDNNNYAPNAHIIRQAREMDGSVRLYVSPQDAVKGVDVVVTDTWVSMGDPEDQKAARKSDFMPYQVNQELMHLADKDAIFMHCLPAYRGYEVTSDVIDDELRSVVYDEAEDVDTECADGAFT
jgi:ornithine carbamoyltransferase